MVDKCKIQDEQFEENLKIYEEIMINKAIKSFLKTDIKDPKELKLDKKKSKRIKLFYYTVNIIFILRFFLFNLVIPSLPHNPHLAIFLLTVPEVIYFLMTIFAFFKYKNYILVITAIGRCLESLFIITLLVFVWILQKEKFKNNILIQEICVLLIFLGVILEYGIVCVMWIYYAWKWVSGKCQRK